MSTRLERLVTMDALIRERRFPGVQDFRRLFEVSERTIHNDIAFLRQRLDAPLTFDRTRQGYVYSDPTWPLPSLLATEGEMVAFFLSIELARRYLGTSFEEPLRKAVAHLSRSLPDEVQVDLAHLTQHYTFQSGATANADPTLLTALLEAIRERWRVTMTYFTASRGERNERVIEPYQLYNVRGDWQVIAFDHLRWQFRNFAVANIEEWHLDKDERFSRDPQFSPEEYLASGFLAERGDRTFEIAIWFDERQAHYIRKREWHPTQRVEEHAGGALTLRFQSGALGEVQRWVMSYGQHARVLEPAELRAATQAELHAALNMYARAEQTATILQGGVVE